MTENSPQQKITLAQQFWYDRSSLELSLPAQWDVHVCSMNGDRYPVLGSEQIRQKISDPIGTGPLSELAKGKKEVAIVVDDMSRPTEAALILPHLLEMLSMAGIPKDCIRFIISLGSHGAHTAEDFRKKLGADVVANYGVYNHNCYENCVDIGATRSGMPLKINAELMQCDLKIGIGAILPHLYTGYSGGGKLFLPGMAHIDTIDQFHSFLTPSEKGKLDHRNPMVTEIEDAVKRIGVDMIVNVLVNTEGRMIDLFSGDPLAVHHEGSRAAERVYATPMAPEQRFDVVISNAHLKVNEGDIALLTGLEAIGAEHGTCVLVMNSPAGQMTHYLMRRFGKFVGGRQAVTRVKLPETRQVIVYSQYKDSTTFDPYENQDRIIWEENWQQVIHRIQHRHGSGSLRVGVIPDGTIQYLKQAFT